MSEMSLQESRNELGKSDRVVNSLLSFFTDPGDWAYVMDCGRHGVVSAIVTHNNEDDPSLHFLFLKRKRIVVELLDGTFFSVIRLGTTPSGVWEACEIDGTTLTGFPIYYTTSELFDLFSRHAAKP